MIKAVLFDLDGTLVDSITDLADSVNSALLRFNLPKREYAEFNAFVGNGIAKMVERAMPEDKSLFDDVLKTFYEIYAQHCADNTVAYGGMPQLVRTLSEKGIKKAVITNKTQEMAEKVVKSAYGGAFDIIFGKREGFPLKPEPDSAFAVMKELSVKPEECIFLGDSGVDIKTGINCGAVPVGVLWGYRTREEILKSGAGYVINKPCELLEIIDGENEKSL